MKAGAGKVKVSFRKAVLPLQGYPRVGVMADGFETDLYARAFIFSQDNQTLALVVLECGFISHHLKAALIEKCTEVLPEAKLELRNLMLCAQHTHSAPGGHSHYAFHNITSKGFRPEIFQAYLNASSEALVMAWRDLEQCILTYNAGEFAEDADVAFNRSLDAYNRNHDVVQRDEMNTHLALNRMMKQLRIGTKEPGDKGLINWFGVQANSISAAGQKVHADNKGYAASLLENDQRTGPNFIAAFCPEAAADVSPNYYGRAKWWARGRYEDEYKSAYANGFLQFELARQMAEDESYQIPISGRLDALLLFADMSAITCDADLINGGEADSTGSPAAGLAFLEGTPPDIYGTDAFTTGLLRLIINYKELLSGLPLLSTRSERKRLRELKKLHEPKTIAIELKEKRVLGYRKLNKLPLPSVLADLTEEVKRQYEAGALKEHSWMPDVVPLQIFRIGELAILGFPGDLSTTAGMRLRKTVMEQLEPHGILDVVITTYANEQAGYAVTPEEYMEQGFEGGYTLFGRMTLPAYQTLFRKLAANLIKPEKERQFKSNTTPPVFSREELDRRSFR
jgi:neutral ceramidase